jgi:autophagy-related protein 5
MNPSIDACRTAFMNMVKEADFVRWGSTRRVTALRKADQDALWEGVVQRESLGSFSPAQVLNALADDYERFWSVAAKLIPAPASSAPSSALSSPPMSREPSSSQGTPSTITDARLPEANAMRSVPLRIYLPSHLPVLQDVVAPLKADGSAVTLYEVLSHQLPAFFPARSSSMTASFMASKPLARAVVHGIEVPFDAEVGFLAATLASPSGFIEVVVKLNRRS